MSKRCSAKNRNGKQCGASAGTRKDKKKLFAQKPCSLSPRKAMNPFGDPLHSTDAKTDVFGLTGHKPSLLRSIHRSWRSCPCSVSEVCLLHPAASAV